MKSIKINPKLLHAIKKALQGNTYVDTANDTGLDVRTVRRALVTGKCSGEVFKKIKDYAATKKTSDEKLINLLNK